MRTIVVSANSPGERDIIVNNIYNQLTDCPDSGITVLKDRLNRISVYHGADTKIVICRYVVIIIPITFSLSSLDGISGSVSFKLDKTVEKLNEIAKTIRTLQATKHIEQNDDPAELEQLITSLS